MMVSNPSFMRSGSMDLIKTGRMLFKTEKKRRVSSSGEDWMSHSKVTGDSFIPILTLELYQWRRVEKEILVVRGGFPFTLIHLS